MEYHEWLKQLKVGDEVIYYAWGWGSFYDLAKVEKITPTGFIRVNGIHFRPDTGYARSGGACIRDPNEEKAMESLKEYKSDIAVENFGCYQKFKKCFLCNLSDHDRAAIAIGWALMCFDPNQESKDKEVDSNDNH